MAVGSGIGITRAGFGGLKLSVEIEGMPRIQKALGVLFEAVSDARPVWQAFRHGTPHQGSGRSLIWPGRRWPDIIQEQYATEGRRGGTPWPSYDATGEPRYKGFKYARTGGFLVLMRWTPGKERLYPSLMNPAHPEHVFTSDARGMVVGTRVPYARGHQLGVGEQKWDKIPLPRRPILALTDRDVLELAKGFQRLVEYDLGIAGLRVTPEGVTG